MFFLSIDSTTLMLNMAFKIVTFNSDDLLLLSKKHVDIFTLQILFKSNTGPCLYCNIRKDMEKAGNDDNNNIFVVALLS